MPTTACLAPAPSPMTPGCAGHETGYVGTLTHAVNGTQAQTLNYTYDRMGNIATVSLGNALRARYTYDGLNRLVQENNYEFGRIYKYTYDPGGNITAKTEYQLNSDGSLGDLIHTASYLYDPTRKDKLISYNDNRSFCYDTETGLYYLETRYYDPEAGRFINSDSLAYLGDGEELSNYNLSLTGLNIRSMAEMTTAICPFGRSRRCAVCNLHHSVTVNLLFQQIWIRSIHSADVIACFITVTLSIGTLPRVILHAHLLQPD